ncbi:MAG: hypothetical protein KDD53_12010, partial [Bdellovibrionales bacterium]|nr:hypothetical protein [Bdellovibrionales bacterium]
MSNKDLSPHIRPLPNYVPLPASAFVPEQKHLIGEVELRVFMRIVMKYKLLIAGIAFVCFSLSILYAFLATPLFTATTTVRISAYQPFLSGANIEDALSQTTKDSFYLQTQINEMQSYTLADRVLQNRELKQELFEQNSTGWLTKLSGTQATSEDDYQDTISGYKSTLRELKQYLRLIEIKPQRRTSLVSIVSTTESPELSAKIANAHALEYIDWVRSTRIDQQSDGLKFLNGQADELKQKVVDLEREIADYAETHSIISLNKDENITVQKMAQLDSLLTEATEKRIEAENLY